MADNERDLETALAESMRDAGISPYHRGTTAEGLASGAIIAALAARGWRLVPSAEEPGELPSPEFTSVDRPYPTSPWAAQPSAEPGLHPDDADAKRRPIQTVGGVRVGAAALTPDRPTPRVGCFPQAHRYDRIGVTDRLRCRRCGFEKPG